MARPKKNQSGPSAKERIVEAFWIMLDEMPYAEISIVPLAKRAQVSPNTLYYHFSGKKEVATYALETILDRATVKSVLVGGSLETAFEHEEGAKRLHRLMLVARSGSLELSNALVLALQNLWLEEAGIDEASLSCGSQLDLTFIFSGIVMMMGSGIELENWQLLLRDFFERPLGQGMVATLRDLRQC